MESNGMGFLNWGFMVTQINGGANVKDRKIIIYGAGEYGKRMLCFLRSLGIEPDWFCQTEIEENVKLEGISILSLKNLYSLNDKLLIFVKIAA